DYRSTDSHNRFGIKLAGQGIHNRARKLFKVFGFNSRFDLFNQNNLCLTDVENKVLLLVREKVLNHTVSRYIMRRSDPSKPSNTADICVKMEFTCVYVNIARVNIIQNNIFNKVIAVVFLIIILLDAGTS